ncbi:MAG: hypothetical protein MHM6MM_002901 [Cercozoa sp. M6MM]
MVADTLCDHEDTSVMGYMFAFVVGVFVFALKVVALLLCILIYLARKLSRKALYLPGEFGEELRQERDSQQTRRCDSGSDYRFRLPLSDNAEEYYELTEASVQEVMLGTSDDVSVSSWLFRHRQVERDTCIVYLHGNAGNAAMRLPLIAGAFHDIPVDLLVLDYRGYGNSDDATPTERGLRRDVAAAIDYVCQQRQYKNVYLLGRSLGGAVAIAGALQYQDHDKLRGVIVENSFDNIHTMALVLLRQLGLDSLVDTFTAHAPLRIILKGLLHICVADAWRSDERVARLCLPVLFVSGEDDELVPPGCTRRLVERTAVCEHWSVPGAGHNNLPLVAGIEYYRRLRDFIRHHNSGRPVVRVHADRESLDETSSGNSNTIRSSRRSDRQQALDNEPEPSLDSLPDDDAPLLHPHLRT